jgi:NADPH:quinone reductase-like Zn-dependent oxidoreductase
MRTMRLSSSTGAPALQEEEIPRPKPGPGEVLVAVHAAGITPTEIAWYPTTHTKSGEVRNQAIPAHEFSGVVAGAGEQVGEFSVGDEIYGMNDWFADGALAEYCIAQTAGIALKPARLTHVEAATVPIAALTSWQGLVDRGKLKSGDRVLIHGAGGAVGIFAVQIARLRGAHVIATCSAQDGEFVRQLGAEQVIDYRTQRFEEMAGDIDLVFDAVGGETFARSWTVLKANGRMVTIAANAEGAADERTKKAFFIVEPNQNQLKETAKLLDAGALKTVVGGVVPLAKASAAYDGSARQTHSRGKLVVSISPAVNNAATA